MGVKDYFEETRRSMETTGLPGRMGLNALDVSLESLEKISRNIT